MQAAFQREVGQHAVDAGRLRLAPCDRVAACLAAAGEVERDLPAVLMQMPNFLRCGNERDKKDIQESF
jgi:hypothetical protein